MTSLELILSETRKFYQRRRLRRGKGAWGKGTPKQSEARYGAGRRNRLRFPKKSPPQADKICNAKTKKFYSTILK